MELMISPVLLIPSAYLIGAVPTAYLLVRLFRGVDVRTVGSGNVGATNAARAGGVWIGLLVFLLDVFKGALPIWLARQLLVSQDIVAEWTVPAVMLAVVGGHVFSVFLRFSGGKGVATAAGAMLVAAPGAAAWCLGLFTVVVGITRYVSLGSVLACGLFAVLAVSGSAFPSYPTGARLLVCSVPVLIIIRHAANIRRLIAGTEHKVGSRAR